MACSGCAFGDAADQHFSAAKAEEELRHYRRKGPGPTTRGLRDGVAAAGASQGALLDIGGGLGILSLELLDAGMSRAVVVDASSGYLKVAAGEAARKGRSNSVHFVHGDFLAIKDQLARAAVVALDRVVCCYPLYQPLLEEALQRADRAFAFSYPRDRWYVKAGMWFENLIRRLSRNPFRTFVHPPQEMMRIVEGAGFELAHRHRTLVWSADVFVRSTSRAAASC